MPVETPTPQRAFPAKNSILLGVDGAFTRGLDPYASPICINNSTSGYRQSTIVNGICSALVIGTANDYLYS